MDEESRLAGYYVQVLGPFVLAFYNSGIIPSLVVYLTELLFFEKMSQKTKSRLIKFYIYIAISTILIQLSKFDDINQVLETTVQKSPAHVFKIIDDNLIGESGFYFRYLITATFISQAAVLMDVPHWISKHFAKKALNSDEPLLKLKKKLIEDGKINMIDQ